LAPTVPKIYVRGAVATNGGYAFFQRFPDRRIDEADIAGRVPVLAEFIEASCADYGLARRPIAVGFSNGAIMAAAVLMARPALFAGAILFRPLSPFIDDISCRLNGVPVLIVDGEHDSRRSTGDGLLLAERLRRCGAHVTRHLLPAGHLITAVDREIAREWLGPLLT